MQPSQPPQAQSLRLLTLRKDGLVFRPKSATLLLATTEYSPALAKRKFVPHEPLTLSPRSSDNPQVKAIFGLLVPPTNVP